MQYLYNLAISVDQVLNAIFNGDPDETLSARAYRTERKNKIFGKVFRPSIDLLFFWQKRHCYHAWLSEVNRKQLHNEYSVR